MSRIWVWRFFLLWLVSTSAVLALQPLARLEHNGVVYERVRWGPVNNGQVLILHNRGSDYIPLSALPVSIQRQLGVKPTAIVPPGSKPRVAKPPEAKSVPAAPVWHAPVEPPPTRLAPTASQVAFEEARANQMLMNGALVERRLLTPLTGFVRSSARVTEGGVLIASGVVLELAKPRKDVSPVPIQYEMRPGLWEPTGEQVFLRDYTTNAPRDDLIRVYGRAVEALRGRRTFEVAQELTYESWKLLR